MKEKTKPTAAQVITAYVDAFNRGDLDAICRLFTPDALVWGVLGWGAVDTVKPIWKELIDCLQIKLKIEAIVTDGDTAVARYIEHGHSVRPFRGNETTGRCYKITAMEWFELRDGLIHRRHGARDSASQFRQLGFAPA